MDRQTMRLHDLKAWALICTVICITEILLLGLIHARPIAILMTAIVTIIAFVLIAGLDWIEAAGNDQP